MARGVASTLFVALAVASVGGRVMVAGDKAKDREECADQLTGLATCLPYVGGQAPAPTPDCCGGLKEVLKNNKKCLCVVIRDRDDPDLGLQINVTLALGLPSVCHAPADVTKCPALLHLDPKSPQAQVFYQLAHASKQSASSPAPAPTSLAPAPMDGSSTNGDNSRTSSARANKGSDIRRKQWLGLKIFVQLVCLVYLVNSKSLI